MNRVKSLTLILFSLLAVVFAIAFINVHFINSTNGNVVANYNDYVDNENGCQYISKDMQLGRRGSSSSSSVKEDCGFDINSYDIQMIVNDDNTYDITETINLTFDTNKHGIYRKIYLSGETKKSDGSTAKYYAKIDNIDVVDNQYSYSTTSSLCTITIGDSGKYVTGNQTYVIKYKYLVGKDKIDSYDELYFNLIGSGWDTTIDNVSFSIQMPHAFDKTKVGFSCSANNFTEGTTFNYSVDETNNIITGSYTGTLENNRALTVLVKLDDGYFTTATNIYDFGNWKILMYVVPIVLLAIAFILWKKFGKDDEVIDVVEFYPPEDMNSLEVGFMHKGFAEQEDVTSLLVYLANKGYIKIQEHDEKSTLLNESPKFTITKVKEYDGKNPYEKLFFDGLFTQGPVINDFRTLFKSYKNSIKANNATNVDSSKKINSVTDLDLKDGFYYTTTDILNKINSQKSKDRIYTSGNLWQRIIVFILATLSILATIITPLALTGSDAYGIIFSVIFIFATFISAWISFSHHKSNVKKIFIALNIVVILLVNLFISGLIPALYIDESYVLPYDIGILCYIGILIFAFLMPKRSEYATRILGKINGFRDFLVTAKKDKLEMLVAENPKYFYDILPYTYALGVSDKWIKQFESINMSYEPDWYIGIGVFEMARFNRFMDRSLNSPTTWSAPSSSSSDIGFGGGFAGGGMGGGGGGSW